ncbi:response regulator [bacterium]|nr:response regulator [bacterium]
MQATDSTKHKVLIVDDEPEIREFLTDYMIERGGYDILEAGNLGEMLDVVKKESDVDLMVLDLIMPDSKGLEALEAIKEHNQDLPVIVLTGYPGLIEPSLAAGASQHFEKPFSPKEIEGIIRESLKTGDMASSVS